MTNRTFTYQHPDVLVEKIEEPHPDEDRFSGEDHFTDWGKYNKARNEYLEMIANHLTVNCTALHLTEAANGKELVEGVDFKVIGKTKAVPIDSRAFVTHGYVVAPTESEEQLWQELHHNYLLYKLEGLQKMLKGEALFAYVQEKLSKHFTIKRK